MIILGVSIMLTGGVLALLVRRQVAVAQWLGCASNIAGHACVVLGALRHNAVVRAAWPLPFASFSVGTDAVSVYFVLIMGVVGACAAWYALDYVARDRRAGVHWLWFNGLCASMLLVVLARNAVLFMVAWELMTLTSCFLVLYEGEQSATRRAGWIYMLAAHAGGLCLLAMFALLRQGSGSYDFATFTPAQHSMAHGTAIFVLALIGFGVKAGVVPLHVWLPEAHPAAPSHVSAVMSAVMIKTGVYGIVRVLQWLPPATWWGTVLIGIGVCTGVYGVLFALAQRDIKRVLAYSSVENIGIIMLGLGLSVLGQTHGLPLVAALGLSGALLHVINHALFKGLLFLDAGAVVHATHTRDMNVLGGLGKRMRWTGATFCLGAGAIAGVPPLNGFLSEVLIYAAAVVAAVRGAPAVALLGVAAALGLALMGGLASACFANAYGMVFLGAPRSSAAQAARECGGRMRGACVLLAVLCVCIAFGAALLFVPWPLLATAASAPARALLLAAIAGGTLLVSIIVLAAGARRVLLRGRTVTQAVTWDCGYAAPDARMQYTATSFAQPLTEQFSPVVQPITQVAAPTTPLPSRAALATSAPDVMLRRVYLPLVAGVVRLARAARIMQQGRVQIYVLYMVLALLALLIWTFW